MKSAFRAKVASAEAQRDEELEEAKRIAELERERLIREELMIPSFEKVLQQSTGCSHAQTKAWGDKYGSGLR